MMQEATFENYQEINNSPEFIQFCISRHERTPLITFRDYCRLRQNPVFAEYLILRQNPVFKEYYRMRTCPTFEESNILKTIASNTPVEIQATETIGFGLIDFNYSAIRKTINDSRTWKFIITIFMVDNDEIQLSSYLPDPVFSALRVLFDDKKLCKDFRKTLGHDEPCSSRFHGVPVFESLTEYCKKKLIDFQTMLKCTNNPIIQKFINDDNRIFPLEIFCHNHKIQCNEYMTTMYSENVQFRKMVNAILYIELEIYFGNSKTINDFFAIMNNPILSKLIKIPY
jgi:hypothetical protein